MDLKAEMMRKIATFTVVLTQQLKMSPFKCTTRGKSSNFGDNVPFDIKQETLDDEEKEDIMNIVEEGLEMSRGDGTVAIEAMDEDDRDDITEKYSRKNNSYIYELIKTEKEGHLSRFVTTYTEDSGKTCVGFNTLFSCDPEFNSKFRVCMEDQENTRKINILCDFNMLIFERNADTDLYYHLE